MPFDRLSEDDPLRQRLEGWFSSVRSVFAGRILEFDERIAIAWGKIVGESMRLGKPRPAVDAQLAATAFVNGMVLVTRNEKDFEHTGVQILNPYFTHGRGMNAARQGLRRFGRTTGTRTRAASSDCSVRAVSFGPEPLKENSQPR